MNIKIICKNACPLSTGNLFLGMEANSGNRNELKEEHNSDTLSYPVKNLNDI